MSAETALFMWERERKGWRIPGRQTGTGRLTPGETWQEWLTQKIFPREAQLTKEQIYDCSRLAILEYLTSGITANFDMYLTPETIAQASVDCGFRTVMTGAVNDFSQSVEEMEGWYREYNHFHELIGFRMGFHAEYTTSEPLLKQIAALAARYEAPVYTHNSETAREVQQCFGDRAGGAAVRGAHRHDAHGVSGQPGHV